MRDHPAEDAAGAGEHGHALARLGLAAEHVAEAGDGEQQQSEADADARVVVHGAGCRNSHTANSSMTTGRANATRPKSPPKVHESSAWAIGR